MVNEIPRWKVQAALRLLGLDDPTESLNEVSIRANTRPSEVVLRFGGIHPESRIPITDTVEDTRLHVLGIDPENGNAELNPVPDDDVTFFEGANMYLHSGTKYSNGTKAPIFKRRS